MADYINDQIQVHDTSYNVSRCVLVDQHGGNERPLAETLTNLEADRDRYKRDLDELSRRHREEHAVVQAFLDKVKGLIVDGDKLVIEDWVDFDRQFVDFDGFDLDRPRREWSAEVKLSVTLLVAGETDATLDEDDIESHIRDSIGFGDIDVNLSFNQGDCVADDSSVEDYDIDSVDVTFND